MELIREKADRQLRGVGYVCTAPPLVWNSTLYLFISDILPQLFPLVLPKDTLLGSLSAWWQSRNSGEFTLELPFRLQLSLPCHLQHFHRCYNTYIHKKNISTEQTFYGVMALNRNRDIHLPKKPCRDNKAESWPRRTNSLKYSTRASKHCVGPGKVGQQ